MSYGGREERGAPLGGGARAAAPARPLVLHISADYPDPHRGPTTTAVLRLVTGSRDADHVVISLSRTSHPGKTHFRDCGMVDGVRLFAYRYFGPPAAVALAPAMRTVADRIAAMLENEGLRPDAIHAHKFAFEGLAGLALARRLGDDVALLVSVRGEAESKIFRFKPHYLGLLQQVADRASRIYYVSAWFRPLMNARLKIDSRKEALLPNIVGNTTPVVPALDPEPRFVCVLNFRIRRRKGLKHLLQAFRLFHARHPGVGLDLIGGGTEKIFAAVNRQIAGLGLEDSVRVLGPMDKDALTQALPKYLALALPSFNETFGMVYVEALFAGIPILYGRGTGIDGYLDGADVGVPATPGNVAEIASALERLYTDNAAYRASTREAAGLLHGRFDPESVLARYRNDLLACMAEAR